MALTAPMLSTKNSEEVPTSNVVETLISPASKNFRCAPPLVTERMVSTASGEVVICSSRPDNFSAKTSLAPTVLERSLPPDSNRKRSSPFSVRRAILVVSSESPALLLMITPPTPCGVISTPSSREITPSDLRIPVSWEPSPKKTEAEMVVPTTLSALRARAVTIPAELTEKG